MQIIFQVQFGFPQLLVPGILYGSSIQLHNHIKYILPGETLIIIPLRALNFSSQYLFVDTEDSSSHWLLSLPTLLLTSFSIQLLIALPTSFFPVRFFCHSFEIYFT